MKFLGIFVLLVALTFGVVNAYSPAEAWEQILENPTKNFGLLTEENVSPVVQQLSIAFKYLKYYKPEAWNVLEKNIDFKKMFEGYPSGRMEESRGILRS